MPADYKEKIGRALDLLGRGLLPFVKKAIEEHPEIDWLYKAGNPRNGLDGLDTQALLKALHNSWNEVFRDVLDRNVRTLVNEAIDIRNRWAHPIPKDNGTAFNLDDAERALDTVCRILRAISAGQAAQVGQMRQELMQERTQELKQSNMLPEAAVPQKVENHSNENDILLKSSDEIELTSQDQIKPLKEHQEVFSALSTLNSGEDNNLSQREFSAKFTANKKTVNPRIPALTLGVLVAGICLSAGAANYFWNNRSCEQSTYVRINGICYKNLAKNPLIIGVLTPPEGYTEFKSYLEKNLGNQVQSVLIKGGEKFNYEDAQNEIAKAQWDIVFALSPMNGMRAKDNGYRWIARMFPGKSSTYQSALYVRADSKIQSINDIKSTTIAALGDYSSASAFYMPAYDLYGKSMSVTRGHRSGEIRELVLSGKADVGAAVYSSIKDDSRFRVIHVSRDIPSSGVYSSPGLSPADHERIQDILMNAPDNLKKEANYGIGEETSYETFRKISVRADEAISCADFTRNPVQFFCNRKSDGLSGKISGFTSEENKMVKLRFVKADNSVCNILVPLQTLSRVPNGTSPGIINGRFVNVVGIQPNELPDGTCEFSITDANQLVVN